ncbi:MAG: FadR/GntR family transcriptional regulator [Sphaerochaetaceae bacterium]|jgi:GntR family transcriptional repressor for pyruvate dehydrogenase complex
MEEKKKRTSVVTEAMFRLKELIISDQYHVGDKIPTELELAKRFGIGRSSIREAIKVFQYLGIVETNVPKGTFLSKNNKVAAELLTWFSILERKSIFEILELREVFEQRGVLNIVQLFQTDREKAEAIVQQLEDEVNNIQKAILVNDYEEIQKGDYNFHHIIIKQTGNDLFNSIFSLLDKFTRKEMSKTHENYADLQKIVEEHMVIVDAIKSEDILTALQMHATHFPMIKKKFTF